MAKTVSELQEVLGQAAKDDPKRRFHSLYDKVASERVLKEAWLRVRKNGGRGGVDGKEIGDYKEPESVEQLITELRGELLSQRYRPQPVLRVMIPKPDGGERPLGIPTIKDRVVQTAAKLILEPIFEADFQAFSYGFREGKSCHQALNVVWRWMNIGHTEVIDADIQGFFDNIPHDKLLRTVARRVSDGKMLRLIKLFLKAPIQDGGRLHKSKKGTPQGGVVSPLLANVYLNHLDRFWVRKGYDKYAKLVRYADDFVLLCKGNTEFYLGEVERLFANLGLELNEKKTRIVDSTQQGFDFLGFTFRRVWAFRPKQKSFGWVTGVGISRKVLKKARKRVNEIIGQGGRKSPVPMSILVGGVNKWLRHWLPYYCFANRKEDFRHLYLKVVLERLVRAEVARRSGNKRRSRKWKSMNPKLWEDRYGLVDVVATYYRKRKQLYASLFDHPINAVT
ncbi:group II intron reverse transcriptase/maturase [bacterium I07]|nr:group II intron reverse transcriptase/maturase [bacterium I07]